MKKDRPDLNPGPKYLWSRALQLELLPKLTNTMPE